MKYRIWWVVNVPNDIFTHEVPGLKEAVAVLKVMACYDNYIDESIKHSLGLPREVICTSTGGLEFYHEEDGEWEEWLDSNGDTIWEYFDAIYPSLVEEKGFPEDAELTC